MRDLPALFKAIVMPYTAICSFTGVVFLLVTGQEVPIVLYGFFFGALGEMGIHWSISNLKRK